MRPTLLWLTFRLFLLFTVVYGLAPQVPVVASTPPSASPATSASILSPSSHTTSTLAPEPTPPPQQDDVTWALQQKWHQSTFWTCITVATQTNCGWREPIEQGGSEVGAAPRVLNRKKMAGLAAAGALIVAGLLL